MPTTTTISEPAILLKPSKLYRPEMSVLELYDITRGVWKVNKQHAELAKIALSVANGAIVGVYTNLAWYSANKTPYLSGRHDQADPKYVSRFEFTGTEAPAALKDKYMGLHVNHLFGSGSVVAYQNC